jgi:hypothetical protein
MAAFMEWWRQRSRKAKIWLIVGAVIAVLALIGALAPSETAEDTSGSEAPPAPTESAPPPPATTESAPPPPEQPPEPPPPEEPEGIGDGTHTIGEDIAAGTYRSTGDSTCYWARLAGFSGEIDDILANGNNAPEIVTIARRDAGFETQGCGDWVPVRETAPGSPASSFADGTYRVGVHIRPGTYRADGEETCYWARLSNFSHQGVGGIITNGNNPTTITIAPGDAGFTASGCGTWTRR